VTEPSYLAAVRESYDTVATDYVARVKTPSELDPLSRAMLAAFADLVQAADRGPVADLGCGPGKVTAHLAGLGVSAFGIDGLRTPVLARPVAALADLAATPLGLWLLRTVYVTPGADPAPLLDPDRFLDAPALRAHLFDHLVGSLITTRPPGEDPTEVFRPSTRHDPDQVRRWLGFLAHYLHTSGTRDLAWWQLARNTDSLPQHPYRLRRFHRARLRGPDRAPHRADWGGRVHGRTDIRERTDGRRLRGDTDRIRRRAP
jgi:SAM-dependent methyltransferase